MKKEIKPFFCTYCDKQVPCGCDKKFHLQEPIKEDWEKRFDDNTYQWEESGCAEESSIIYWDKIKSFIRQLLAQANQQYRQEILDRLPKDDLKDISLIKEVQGWDAGFSYALNKIKELITKI